MICASQRGRVPDMLHTLIADPSWARSKRLNNGSSLQLLWACFGIFYCLTADIVSSTRPNESLSRDAHTPGYVPAQTDAGSGEARWPLRLIPPAYTLEPAASAMPRQVLRCRPAGSP